MPQLPAFDALTIPATRQQINETRDKIHRLPVTVSSGVYQYDRVDEDYMRKTANNMPDTMTVDWRQRDNTPITLSKMQLSSLIDECEMAQFNRGVMVDAEAQQFKADLEAGNPPTLRDLENWKEGYSV